MRDLIEFLKGAINRQPIPGMFGCYHIADGFIYAQNLSMQASAPIEMTDNFSVSAEELEAALSRSDSEPRIELKDKDLIVKVGRIRATIPIVEGTPPTMFSGADTEWLPVPESLVPSLVIGLKFLLGTGQGWTTGIRLMDGRLTVVNSFCGIDIALPGWQSPPSILTKDGAEFLIAHPPEYYSAVEGGLLFSWSDGRLLNCRLIDQEMPNVVDRIFADAGQDAPIEITDDFRSAFADALAVSEEKLELCSTHLTAYKGASRITVEVQTDIPKDHISVWTTKVLQPMIETASSWNPLSYPKPCLFRGGGLYGVVMGRSR